MGLDEFLDLKREYETKRRQADRAQVLFEQAQKKLEELGFEDEGEARVRLKELDKEIKSKEKEFAAALGAYREKYEKYGE